MAVTSYGCNKNHDDEIKKNQEKANNSPSYRCAAIKKRQRPNTIQILWIVKNQEHRNIASLSLQLRSYKKERQLERLSIVHWIGIENQNKKASSTERKLN